MRLESRSCRVATVLGEAGAGKSRLAQELATVVGDRAAVLEGRCVPYGEGITYFPLAIMLKPLAGIEDEDSRETARAKLLALLADVEDASLDRRAPRGSDRARRGARAAGGDRLGGPSPAGDARPGAAAARVLRRPALGGADVSAARPVPGRAQPGRADPARLLVTARSERRPIRPLCELPGARTIELESLPDQAAGALIANLLGDEVAPEIALRIEEVAEGNPLFIEETVRMLLDEGLIDAARRTLGAGRASSRT